MGMSVEARGVSAVARKVSAVARGITWNSRGMPWRPMGTAAVLRQKDKSLVVLTGVTTTVDKTDWVYELTHWVPPTGRTETHPVYDMKSISKEPATTDISECFFEFLQHTCRPEAKSLLILRPAGFPGIIRSSSNSCRDDFACRPWGGVQQAKRD